MIMTIRNTPIISVVIPVKNGETLIGTCLSSLQKLNYPKNKIEQIIVDNKSIDNTRTIARKFHVRIVTNTRGTVSSGRNIGFAKTKGEFVAFTDVDCTFDANWLINAVKYFRDPRVAMVSGPNLIPKSEKPFARAVGLIFDTAYFFRVGSPTRRYQKVIESRSHGSNMILRKSYAKKVFPVDETMVEGEDVLLTHNLETLGYKLLYAPNVMVHHFRRSTPDRWFNQMMRYAQAKVLMRRRGIGNVNFLHDLVGFTIPIGILLVVLCFFIPWLFTVLVDATLFFGIMLLIYSYVHYHDAVISLNFIFAFGIMVVAWSVGYLTELVLASNRKWKDR